MCVRKIVTGCDVCGRAWAPDGTGASTCARVCACGLLCNVRSRALCAMCEFRELVQYGSRTGACDNEIACSLLVCGSVCRGVHVRESVPQYGPRPPGLCTSVYVCTVRTLKGFIQCTGARPPGFCTSVYFSTAQVQTDSVRCEPARALKSFNDWGGGGDVTNLSPFWEETARK